MGLFLRKILVFTLAVLLAALAIDPLLTRIFQKGRTVKAQWINNMRGEHYDLAVLGSSRAWWNIDMNEMGRRCSIRGINMANNHFTFSEILLALKFFLANGNQVDRVLLQIDPHNMRAEQDEFSSTVYDYLPWLKDSLVYDHLRPRSNEWPLLRTLPAARYVKYNFRWGPEEALVTLLGTRNTIFDSTGSFFIDRKYKGWPYLEVAPGDYQPDEDLIAILQLCQENNIRVDLFTAPYYRLRMVPEEIEEYRAMLDRHSLQVHDFSDRLDNTIYFDNNWHLSLQGGRLFTAMLVEEVVCPDKNPAGRSVQ